MFKRLFGAGKPGPSGPGANDSTIDAIQRLTEREEQLEKRKTLIDKRINEELDKAKDFTRQKKKNQALMCLKKKKMYEQQGEQIETLILRVNEQKMMLESQRTTADVIHSMHAAAKASKDTMQAMNIDNVDKVMDEIQDQNDKMRIIQDAISQPTGLAADLDEDELLGELEELEAEEMTNQLLEPAPVPANKVPSAKTPELPSVPTKAPAKTAEELELEALQAEMAL